jgi:DNA-directed RNA polymerase specialized sigma24 family protein
VRPRSTAPTSDAIEDLYRRRFGAFVRTSYAITRDTESARDVVQEAFALALRRRSALRRAASLESWVWRIVVTRSLDAARRRARAKSQPLWGLDFNVPVDVSGGGDPEIAAAVRGLPERQRLALFLRYYADLDYDAIAEALNITPGTVGASLNAAHRALKVRLAHHEL